MKKKKKKKKREEMKKRFSLACFLQVEVAGLAGMTSTKEKRCLIWWGN